MRGVHLHTHPPPRNLASTCATCHVTGVALGSRADVNSPLGYPPCFLCAWQPRHQLCGSA